MAISKVSVVGKCRVSRGEQAIPTLVILQCIAISTNRSLSQGSLVRVQLAFAQSNPILSIFREAGTLSRAHEVTGVAIDLIVNDVNLLFNPNQISSNLVWFVAESLKHIGTRKRHHGNNNTDDDCDDPNYEEKRAKNDRPANVASCTRFA